MPAALKKSAQKSAPPLSILYQPGSVFEGGYYAGSFYDDGKPYALIVAAKADGEKEAIAWHSKASTVKGALSYSNGPANTAAMAKAGSALAQWALKLNIQGNKDWYLPSRLEALLLFGELRGLKTFSEEQANGFACEWYWTSTQSAGYGAFAWSQSFGYGYQSYDHKYHQLRARAVRRIAI